MNTTTRSALGMLIGLAVLAAPPPVAGQGIAQNTEVPAAARRAIEQVEEVTVTARKREEPLEDTPVSVTALGETALRDASVQKLDEIDKLVPNLDFLSFRSGQEAQVLIRGIGPVDEQITTDPGVGIYVDGVYLSRAAGSVLQLFDVDRIEVLRGPQGTLFGKNTDGGAINVTTVKPREELEGTASVRAGNFDTVNTRFTVNIPVAAGGLKDKLFTRFSLMSANSEGYTKNTLRDQHYSDTNAIGTVASVRFLPTDDIEFNLNGTYYRDHARGKGGQCVYVASPPNPAAAGLIPADYQTACRSSQPFTFQSDIPAIADIESYGMWATLAWNIGNAGPFEDLVVKAISSWRQQVPRQQEDVDMTRVNVAFQSAVGGGGRFDGEPGSARQVSQELQANGKSFDGRLTSVAGMYGFWDDAHTQQLIVAVPDAPQFARVAGAASTFNDIKVDNWSYATYGQSTLDITKSVSLTGGLRWSLEKKGYRKRSENLAAAPSSNSRVPVNANQNKTFDAWTPMASVAYRLPEDLLVATPLNHLMTYFTYSQGFKSGGFNGGARFTRTPGQLDPYLPEHVRAYEVGLKTIGLDRRVSLNLALFMSDYSNIQVISTRSDPRLPLNIDRVVLNAAQATIRGLETEAEVRPFTGMNLMGSIALLDAKYDDFPNATNALTGTTKDPSGRPFNRAGESFPAVPDYRINLVAQYTRPVGAFSQRWLNGWVTPRLDYYYQNAVNYYAPELPQARQRGFGLLGARLSYDFNDDRNQVAVWAKNLTDETYFRQALGGPVATFGGLVRYYDPPRTFGAEITYRF